MRPGKFHLVVIIVIVLVIAIEGGFLIELLSEILETVIEGLEMIFGTLFEVLLGLSPRGAQVLTAWLATGLVLGGSALFLSRRGRILRQTLIDSWRESIRRLQDWYVRNRLTLILILSGVILLWLLTAF
jgi:hypothetical protein